MAAAELRPLLAHRLIIITGKGGTGKTSVSAALALLAARRGRRVLVAEVGSEEHLPRLLAPGTAPVGYTGRTLEPGLHAMRIDPYAALSEYLGLQIGARTVIERVLRTKAFRQLMDASPGWRELITLGKLWHLEQMRDEDGRNRYDLIIVDAPATGHGITFLDAPRVVISAVRTGPLHRHATWVEEMITDSQRTLLLPVSLAEELPARETAELVQRLRTQVRIHMDRVVVNGVMPAPFPSGLEDLAEHLRRLPEAPLPGLPPVATLRACVRHLGERWALNQQYVGEIGRSTGLEVVTLPYVAQGISGPEELGLLASALVPATETLAA